MPGTILGAGLIGKKIVSTGPISMATAAGTRPITDRAKGRPASPIACGAFPTGGGN